ncbi:MAG: hypothetical protein GC150_12315 [Rhizobiales bacterium]|nr:hypothetical protein [Hyphomicrobiales bacterium]
MINDDVDVNWMAVGFAILVTLIWLLGLLLASHFRRTGEIVSGSVTLELAKRGAENNSAVLLFNIFRLFLMLAGSGLLYITGMMLYVGLENVALLSRDGMHQALTIVALYAVLLITVFNVFYQLVQQPLFALRVALQKFLPNSVSIVLFCVEVAVMAVFLAFISFVAASMFVGQWNALQLMALWIVPVIMIAVFRLSILYKSNIALFFAVISVFHLGYLRAKHLHERPSNFLITTSDAKLQEANIFVTTSDGLYYFAPGNSSRASRTGLNCAFLSSNQLTFKPWTAIVTIDPTQRSETEIARAVGMVLRSSDAYRYAAIESSNESADGELSGLLTGTAYMFGILLGVFGFLKIKDHVGNAGQHRISEGAICLSAGGGLFALPIVYDSMATCIGKGSGVTEADLNKIQFNLD